MNKIVNSAQPSFFLRLFSSLYGATWRLARPLLARHKRLQHGFASRLVPDAWVLPQAAGQTIWVQAASGGEAYLVLALWRHLQSAYTGSLPLRVLATTCTKQGMDVLGGVNALHDKVSPHPKLSLELAYFPFDEPLLMQKALELAKPELICLLETELWPGLLLAANKKHIPILLLNGRITSKSLNGYKFFPSCFWQKLAPKRILAISKTDASRFTSLFGAEQVGLMHNIKFDLLLQQELQVSEQTKFLPKLVVFGSVRKQEAKGVARPIAKLVRLNPDLLIALAPRHLHHASLWKSELSLAGLEPCFCVDDKDAKPLDASAVLENFMQTQTGGGARVLIWNRFGDLKMLYSMACAVFVGGSLAPLGGQNFLEVLEHGLVPVIGPHWSNFAWAGDEILALVRKVDNSEELAFALDEQIRKPQDKKKVRESFKKFVLARQGGTKVAAELVLSELTSD